MGKERTFTLKESEDSSVYLTTCLWKQGARLLHIGIEINQGSREKYLSWKKKIIKKINLYSSRHTFMRILLGAVNVRL